MNGRAWRTALMVVAVAAAPQGASAAVTPAATAVTLPFAPPVNIPLRYDFEMRSEVGGNQRQKVRTVDELTYTLTTGGGYVLRWMSGSLQVEAPGPMQKVLEKTYAALMGIPMLIAVSSSGAPERIINVADIRAGHEKALRSLAQSIDSEFADLPAEARDTANSIMTAMLDQQRQQSDAIFEAGLMEGPQLMLPAPGPMVPGQAVVVEFQQPSPLGAGNIGFLAQIILRDFKPGVSAEVVASSVANPEDARRAMASFVAILLANIPDVTKRQEVEARLAKTGPMTVSDEAVTKIALPDGLTETMHYEKQVSIPGRPVRRDTRSYARVR